MVIQQGEVYWVDLGEPIGSAPGYQRPHVVIQNNLFNRSRINTVLVCPLTSNLKRAASPGNVQLAQGEANLTKPSVALVSQIVAIDKTQLGEYVGSLSEKRVRQILEGLRLLTEPRDID